MSKEIYKEYVNRILCSNTKEERLIINQQYKYKDSILINILSISVESPDSLFNIYLPKYVEFFAYANAHRENKNE